MNQNINIYLFINLQKDLYLDQFLPSSASEPFR